MTEGRSVKSRAKSVSGQLARSAVPLLFGIQDRRASRELGTVRSRVLVERHEVDLGAAKLVVRTTSSSHDGAIPASGGVQLRRELPAVDELRDVVYVPAGFGGHEGGAQVLCSQDGRVIKASRVESEPGGPVVAWASRTPPDFRAPPASDVVDSAVIYVGHLATHFGHFLTEGVSRLWFPVLHEQSALPLVFHGPEAALRIGFVGEFLHALGLEASRFLPLNRPTLLRQVIIPGFSSALQWKLHDVHIELLRRAGSQLRQPRPASSSSRRPIYLSRSRLGSRQRRVAGERALEGLLTDWGVRVAHPEILSLRDQVMLFEDHRPVMGPMGSAHHTAALLEDPSHHVYLDVHGSLNPNHLLIDAASGDEVCIARCLEPILTPAQKSNRRLLPETPSLLEPLMSSDLN